MALKSSSVDRPLLQPIGPSLDRSRRCVEQLLKSRKKRGASENLVDKLWQRQLLICCPAQAYHQTRSVYQCIVPNHTEQGVQPPSGFLRKFSPDGRSLLAFSNDQRNVLVYEYRGASAAQSLYLKDCSEDEIKMRLFECFFRLRFSIPVAQNAEHLNRECSLFSEDCQYAVVVSSDTVAELPNMLEIFRNNESISANSVSILEDYTLYLVDIVGGVVADSKMFKCDKINLSHNQGLSLCNSRLAVLSLQQQTIHLFKIAGGALVPLQEIGRFCYPDDTLMSSDSVVYESAAPYEEHPLSEKWFTTLKHRLLCFLLMQAEQRSTQTDRFTLLDFFRKYENFRSLRIAKVQFLDEFHLLLKYTNEEVVIQKQNDSSSPFSLYVVYNITTTDILSAHDNISKDFLEIYETHFDSFRSPISHPLCQDVSSLSNNAHSRALHLKFKQTITSAKYGGSLEATRRLLGQLPMCSQSFSSSPYLDHALFSYDDKWISPLERPKPCGDNPVKLVHSIAIHYAYTLLCFDMAQCMSTYSHTYSSHCESCFHIRSV